MKSLLTLVSVILLSAGATRASADIVHDGEYEYLRMQHGDKWDAEDQEIDRKLADIRRANGGERPNIFYILIDDVSFGQMGQRAMNYVTGIDTPNINEFAEQGHVIDAHVHGTLVYTDPGRVPDGPSPGARWHQGSESGVGG